MTTINVSLDGLGQLIARLESLGNNLHQLAVRSYPDPVYQSYDTKSIECRYIINFFLLVIDSKELELGIRQLNLDLTLLSNRQLQLEKFLYTRVDSHKNDLMSAMTNISSDIIDKKYQMNLLQGQLFHLEIPESIADTLKEHSLVFTSE
jgi:hypothetical protein